MKKPERVIDIDRALVHEFAKTQSVEEVKWMKLALEKANLERGEQYGFAAFRVEFAERYYPEIIAKKKRKPTLLDDLTKMLEEAM